MAKTFDITFDKFIYDGEFDEMPSYKGVYLFRLTERKDGKLYPTIVYIGVAEGEKGLAGRVNDSHNKLEETRKLVKKEQNNGKDVALTISYTNKKEEYDSYWNRIEAALIIGRQPELNDEYTKNFSFPKTTVNISGTRCCDLKEQYVIETKENN